MDLCTVAEPVLAQRCFGGKRILPALSGVSVDPSSATSYIVKYLHGSVIGFSFRWLGL